MTDRSRQKHLQLIQTEKKKARVEELMCQGYRPLEISRILGLTPQKVSLFTKNIMESWREFDEQEPLDKLNHRIAELDLVHRWSSEAFKRSQENVEQVRTSHEPRPCPECRTNPNPDCERCEGTGRVLTESTVRTNTGQAGEPAFLRMIVECVKEKSRLQGLRPNARASEGLIQVQNIINTVESKDNRFLDAPGEAILDALEAFAQIEKVKRTKVIEARIIPKESKRNERNREEG